MLRSCTQLLASSGRSGKRNKALTLLPCLALPCLRFASSLAFCLTLLCLALLCLPLPFLFLPSPLHFFFPFFLISLFIFSPSFFPPFLFVFPFFLFFPFLSSSPPQFFTFSPSHPALLLAPLPVPCHIFHPIKVRSALCATQTAKLSPHNGTGAP